MKILFVAMSNSPHTARWIAQLKDSGYDIHLFPSIDYGETNYLLDGVTVHHGFYYKKDNTKVKYRGFYLPSKVILSMVRYFVQNYFPNYRVSQLSRLIKKIKPDVIHSLEFQSGAYLTLEAKKRTNFLHRWIVTNWGSDIYLFSNLETHKKTIQDVLKSCDAYSCECNRDIALARKLGFESQFLPVIPNGGGLEEFIFELNRKSEATSKRKKIILKGYHGWSGRALVALKAIEMCESFLRDYKVVIFSGGKEMVFATAMLSANLNIEFLDENVKRDILLKEMSESRVFIGLSISDGLSTSSLEAAALGSYVVQSSTSCLEEVLKDDYLCAFVDPNDPYEVASAIKEALVNDELVDNAREKNLPYLEEHFSFNKIRSAAESYYGVCDG